MTSYRRTFTLPIMGSGHIKKNVYIAGGVRKRTLLALTGLLISASACASIDPQSAPRDWPRLTIDVRKVSYLEVLKRCSKYSPAPLACAEIHFRTLTCYVWVTPEAPKWVLEHELGHCGGADHYGESTLRDAWAAYKGTR